MTTMIDVKYGAMEPTEISPKGRKELEEKYSVSLGKYVYIIKGILGPIMLFFSSKIGLNYPLRGREWEITYSSEEGPGGEGLVAIRAGADKALTAEDYAHLYKAWYRDDWQKAQLYLLHNERLYMAGSTDGPPANRLYLMDVAPVDDIR